MILINRLIFTHKTITKEKNLIASILTLLVFSVFAQTNVSSIADLRLQTQGQKYCLTSEAVITYIGDEKSLFIEDATGAIMIYDYNNALNYNLNDGISGICGELQDFNGMLQIFHTTGDDPGVASSTGNTVIPETITLDNLDDTYEAKLIKIENVDITETGVFAAKQNYTITDITGSSILRTNYNDLDYIGNPIPQSSNLHIVGVVYQYKTTTEIVPRSSADFSTVYPMPLSSTGIFIGIGLLLTFLIVRFRRFIF